ncbi:MAG: DUF481 domain-containing protein [Planctomycetota bacterium]
MNDLVRIGMASVLVGAAGLGGAQVDEHLAPAPESDVAEGEELPQWDSLLDGWSGGVSLGLFGSEGNTDQFDFRAEINGERDTKETRSSFLGTYSYATDNDGISENEARVIGRNDWKFEGSKWFAFASGQFDYDEFQDWDTRVSIFAGPGYVWTDTEKQRFMTRAGAGATREIGGSDNAWRAEGVLAAEYRRQLTENQLFNASAEAFPDLGDIRNWRVQSRATWEMLVDPEIALTLKIGVENQYDTDPNGVQRSDTDYFILLTWNY